MSWQDLVAIGAASGSALYLVVRLLAFLRRREAAGCGGGCASCPATSKEEKAPVGFVPESELREIRRTTRN